MISGKHFRETLQQGGTFSVLNVNVVIEGSIDPRAMLSLFSTCVILPASVIYYAMKAYGGMDLRTSWR
jgi:hypothetical protein